MRNSAVMGAAYQAKHGLYRDKQSFEQITKCLPEPKLVCQPYNDAEFVSSTKSIVFRKKCIFYTPSIHFFRYINQ